MFYVWYFDLLIEVGLVLGRPIPVGTRYPLYHFPGVGVKRWGEGLNKIYRAFNGI